MHSLLLRRLLSLLTLLPLATHAQQVGIGTATPDASAVLELRSTTQGLLPPRLTAPQRAAIASPATGLLVYQTDGTPGLYQFSGLSWVSVASGRIPDASGYTVPTLAYLSTISVRNSATNILDPSGFASMLTQGMASDGTFMYYSQGPQIRRVTIQTGQNIVLTGQATAGYADGAASTALFSNAANAGSRHCLTLDAAGNLYVADQGNYVIRKVDTRTGTVTTLAGVAGTRGAADGPAATATFGTITAFCMDALGALYIYDNNTTNTIRRLAGGIVTTLAGGSSTYYADGVGTAVGLTSCYGMAADASGNVYFSSYNYHTIRKLVPGAGANSGTVSTIAGTPGQYGYQDGPGATALFTNPPGVCLRGDGYLYIVAPNNARIRRLELATGIVSAFAGTGTMGNDDGTLTAATLSFPSCIITDQTGALYLGQSSGSRLRVIR